MKKINIRKTKRIIKEFILGTSIMWIPFVGMFISNTIISLIF